MMHPIPLTEAILHHAYNNEESSAIRTRIMDLEQKLRSLADRRKAVESFEEQISIEAASRELRDRFDEEKAHWKKLSWAMEVKSNSISKTKNENYVPHHHYFFAFLCCSCSSGIGEGLLGGWVEGASF